MKSWIHTARFSRSKSAEKGSGTSFTIVGITVRNSIFVKYSLSANGFFFCFLLITMNSTCERPSSHFSRDGLDGRPSSLARVKLKQRIMDVHIFPQDSKWKKIILKYPFIDVPPSSSLQFLPPTSFNCRDWPRSSAGNPISKKRDRILWSLFHIPELGSGEEATSSDHIKPSVFRVFRVKGEGLENWYLSLFEATGNTVRARWGRDFYGYDIEKVEGDEMRCNCIALLMKFMTKHRE